MCGMKCSFSIGDRNNHHISSLLTKYLKIYTYIRQVETNDTQTYTYNYHRK